MHSFVIMPRRREKLFNQVIGTDLQAACAHAWMAADILTLQDVFIYEQLHILSMVIHQAHDTDRAGFYVQIFQTLYSYSQ